jgi:alpha-glucosidase (family GH31 glycosyl hydrolase)
MRPFILSRSTTLGAGKYAFHWLGDNRSIYDDLKYSISGLFNFNIFGIPFSGADICGFTKNSNKELCIRWYNLGIFYPFMRNHKSIKRKDQFPWSFEENNKKEKYNAINIIKKNINLRYSLLRYLYSQLFLISLNEKSSIFKPVMFEFPNDENSYKDIESKIMFGEAFLICTFYNSSEEEKIFEIPDSNFNEYLSGKSIMNYGQENNTIKLSGNLDLVHIFMRGGFIIPYQNTFDKYILNSKKLRDEKINLIININVVKQSKGIIFFDNDEVNAIKNRKYYRVDLFFIAKRLVIKTNKNKLKEYKYNDHILGKIELWRVSEIFEMDKEENKDKKFNIIIDFNNELEEKERTIDGIYDKENNKVIFEISQKDKNISLFDIDEILFN